MSGGTKGRGERGWRGGVSRRGRMISVLRGGITLARLPEAASDTDGERGASPPPAGELTRSART